MPPRLLSLLAATALAGAVLAGCSSEQEAQQHQPFDPAGKTLAQLESALDSGAVTSVDLVDYYLGRIRADNHQGAAIDAVTSLDDDALDNAAAADAARADGEDAGPLAGIPFLVKDNYDVEGMATTGGSAALTGNIATSNAAIVQDLVDAGGIVLGKTNMSELAASYGWLGYSSAGGQTKNPWDLDRDASGSSSGSAAAVAAGFAPYALGSDTGGSIRGPANVTGTVGMRVTFGHTSRDGVMPLASDFDVTGVITRTVADQALVLDAITGPDEDDPATADAPTSVDYADDLDHDALDGASIGVVTNFAGDNADVDAVFADTVRAFRRAGASTVRINLPTKYEKLWSSVMGPVGNAEFVSEWEAFMQDAPQGVPATVKELIRASKALADTDQPVNPGRISGYESAEAAAGTLDSPKVQRILTTTMPQLRAQLEKLMAARGVSALALPTMTCPASVIHDVTDDTYECTSDDTYAGEYISSSTHLPDLTVPAGTDSHGLPVGVSFVGPADSEGTLLGLGAAWEEISPFQPMTTPTALEN
ncbi:amidase [Nocardioides acrostichi]|uniref:Amidase n=1 Tax=Nocardioides acrostichi TaxID=2784339 RepID=A0A930V135_9ACTN|nr:amidase family protein [Nocardioides acrostichi]MBF4162745.1 amidase [Nocardioides acrostichi]